jgi:hypothetical protein
MPETVESALGRLDVASLPRIVVLSRIRLSRVRVRLPAGLPLLPPPQGRHSRHCDERVAEPVAHGAAPAPPEHSFKSLESPHIALHQASRETLHLVRGPGCDPAHAPGIPWAVSPLHRGQMRASGERAPHSQRQSSARTGGSMMLWARAFRASSASAALVLG